MVAGATEFLAEIVGQQLIEDYCGAWAMDERRFSALVARIESLDIKAHVASARQTQQPYEPAYQIIGDGIALIEIRGTMTKKGSSLGGGGTVAVRDQLRRAARDPVVGGIMLLVESPGGTVSGTAELAAAIEQAKAVKPVHVYGEDLVASAAMWAAAQASFVSANQMASIGSIGTLLVVADYSKAYDSAGIKVHVVSTGPFKGAGVPGSQITEEQLAYFQEEIQKVNQHFLAAVAKGRAMSIDKVAELATGRVWIANEAKTLGLIDAVESFDSAIERLQAVISAQKGKKQMSTTTTTDTRASVEDIEAACPGASSDFVLEQYRRKVTAQEAGKAWIAHQNAKLAEMQTKLEEAAAREAKLAEQQNLQVPGNAPLQQNHGQEVGTTATDEWHAKIRKYVDAGMSQHDAALRVHRENPGLSERRLNEWVPKPGKRD